MSFSRPNPGPDPVEEARRAEQERAARVRATSSQVNQIFDERYGPAYYEGLGDAFSAHYRPQINDQFTQAQRAVRLRFADNADSSASNRTAAQLAADRMRAEADLGSATVDAQNRARQEVEGRRSQIIGLAEAGASQENTAAMARAATNSNLGAPTYSPMGELFGRYIGGLTRTAQAENQGYATNPFMQRQVDFLRGGRSSGTQRIVG